MTAKRLAPADPPDPAERRRRIEAEPLPASLWELLERAAAAVPEVTLWEFFESGETDTYAGLRTKAARLAHGLSRHGVASGTAVGVMLPNVAALPTTWFALARLGAVMVPINVRYTGREVRYVLEDSGATHLVVHADYLPVALEVLGHVPGLAEDRVFVVGDAVPSPARAWQALIDAGRPDVSPGPMPDREALLNIQYTSGTTGMPKGCLLTHRHWLTCGTVNARRDGRTYRRILASTPFFYMDPQWLLLMTIIQRGTLYVAARQSASRFMGWVRRYGIEFCLFPELAFKEPPSPADADNALIRMNVYGIRREHHAEIERRFGVVAREAYGMTELGSAMYMPIEATDMVGSGSCGIPSPFRECRIVDEEGREVPAGTVGELQIRGPGMMLGYHNKPEANAAAFDGPWFRTGDLFRRDERGYFYLVGRLKDMVRRSGENVAAREVEEVLRGLPEVAEAAVVAVPDETRGEEVKAYVVLQPGLGADDVPPRLILEHCARTLASFKVPRYIEYLTEMPRTASGKIAKADLRRLKADPRAGSFDRVENRWR